VNERINVAAELSPGVQVDLAGVHHEPAAVVPTSLLSSVNMIVRCAPGAA
jgi:hypothetical protein